ncbi:CPBP family intramembrane metalloprotease [Arthrobacter sp. FW306-05-C]|uniref:CPBP family intramembrane glutamic endopeptidase n=1 Tax=Arthrobacter TaxID=1663 RepID=UPI001EF09C8F|nr:MULTISPECIES: CPBP family intramembrane glutamic endopeptidase [Arthrobacter]MDP9987556.1 membrane protease YdiL (CAAX protease family) [Arthrobacter oryzae]UKA68596.1 CPBP family intramembrane metalloprotease [Arthrobacter sp. FW306-05-C]UKA77231.1 CPBP family intramembrane metalloprotease [Arthrobacter sp. FW306-07-I]
MSGTNLSGRAHVLPRFAWPVFLVGAILLLSLGNPAVYGVGVPVAALVFALVLPTSRPRWAGHPDWPDIGAVAALYLGVVALFWLAFRVFTQGNTLGLFLSFAAGMLLGVLGPIGYNTWIRRRSLDALGISRKNLGQAFALGLALAAVQFVITLWGYPLPRPVDWVPLAALAITVGFFEAVFFRGFIQARLEASFGPIAGVAGAAALYAAYHVGYGMTGSEMLFLFGLGVVYAVAFSVARNLIVLWPLLVPLGSFYSNLRGGSIRMPWEAILGFADVLGLMVAAVWFAARHERRSGLAGVRGARDDKAKGKNVRRRE